MPAFVARLGSFWGDGLRLVRLPLTLGQESSHRMHASVGVASSAWAVSPPTGGADGGSASWARLPPTATRSHPLRLPRPERRQFRSAAPLRISSFISATTTRTRSRSLRVDADPDGLPPLSCCPSGSLRQCESSRRQGVESRWSATGSTTRRRLPRRTSASR